MEILVFVLGIIAFSILPINNLVIYSVLIMSFVLVFPLSKKYQITVKDLGFTNNFRVTLLPWVLLTCTMLLAVVIAKIYYPSGIFTGILKDRSAFLYIIPVYVIFGAFIQEFLFRGYFFARVKDLMTANIAIVLNIALFSFFHLPYIVHFQSSLFYLSIIGGIFWSICYARYPNMILAWMSHAFVGATTLLLLQKF